MTTETRVENFVVREVAAVASEGAPANLPATVTAKPSASASWLDGYVPAIAASVGAVAGASLLAAFAPPEVTVVGAAILSAAAAGVAATRVFGQRVQRASSIAVMAGLAGIAALTTVGAVTAMNHGKAALATELATTRAALEAERKGIVWFSSDALAKEEKQLTPRQRSALMDAIRVYNSNDMVRFTTEPFAPGTKARGDQHRRLDSTVVLATLLKNGRLYAGRVTLEDGVGWVLRSEDAYTITSVAKLMDYLRLTTGRELPGEP